MTFLIKYIRDGMFVATEAHLGPLEEAAKAAAEGLRKYGAEIGAVMDEKDLDGAPRALVTADP